MTNRTRRSTKKLALENVVPHIDAVANLPSLKDDIEDDEEVNSGDENIDLEKYGLDQSIINMSKNQPYDGSPDVTHLFENLNDKTIEHAEGSKSKKRKISSALDKSIVDEDVADEDEDEDDDEEQEDLSMIKFRGDKRLGDPRNLKNKEKSSVKKKLTAKQKLEEVLKKEKYVLQGGELDEIIKYTSKRSENGVEIIPFFLDGYRAGIQKAGMKKEVEMVKLVESMTTLLRDQREVLKTESGYLNDLRVLVQSVSGNPKEMETVMPKSVNVPKPKDKIVSKPDEPIDIGDIGPGLKFLSSMGTVKVDDIYSDEEFEVKEQETTKSNKKLKMKKKKNVETLGEKIATMDVGEKYEFYKTILKLTDDKIEKWAEEYDGVSVFLSACQNKGIEYWEGIQKKYTKVRDAKSSIYKDVKGILKMERNRVVDNVATSSDSDE